MTATTIEIPVQSIAQQLSGLQQQIHCVSRTANNYGHQISSLKQQLETYQSNINAYIQRASDPDFLGNPNSRAVKDAQREASEKIKTFQNQIKALERDKSNFEAEATQLEKQAEILREEATKEYETLITRATELAGVVSLCEQMVEDTLVDLRAIAAELNDFAPLLNKPIDPVRVGIIEVKIPQVLIGAS